MTASLRLLLKILLLLGSSSLTSCSCTDQITVEVPEVDASPPEISWLVRLPDGNDKTVKGNDNLFWTPPASSRNPDDYAFFVTMIAKDPQSGIRSVTFQGAGATNCGWSCSGYKRINFRQQSTFNPVGVGQVAFQFAWLQEPVNLICQRLRIAPQSITGPGGVAELKGEAQNNRNRTGVATLTLKINGTFPDEPGCEPPGTVR